MRLRIATIAFCLSAVIFWMVSPAYAADVLARLTHGDQYALALGTVASVSDSIAKVEVEAITVSYTHLTLPTKRIV